VKDEPKISKFHMENGVIEMDIVDAQRAMVFYTAAMRKLLDGAENYVEMSFRDKEKRCDYVLTLQRKEKPTPHELRRLAESEKSQLIEVARGLANLTESALDSSGLCTCFHGMKGTQFCSWHEALTKHKEILKRYGVNN